MSQSLPSTAPSIAPMEATVERPLWSVMIPTFNCARYLRQTLESVLAQDPGADQMQVEVVDDCSTMDDPEAVVRDIGQGRVVFYRKPQNEGAIANFNTCIERSRGHLVHILHGDDYVLPGFYKAVGRAQEQFPEVALIATRCFFIDEDGLFTGLSQRVPRLESSGREVDDFFYATPIQCAGVVMRRRFYERNGGFRADLPHGADTEMWTRAVGMEGGVVLPQVLAAYRMFPGNDTGRLMRTADNLRDREQLIKIFSEREPTFDREEAVKFMLLAALHQYDRFISLGDMEAAQANSEFWEKRASLGCRLRRAVRLLLLKLDLFVPR